MVKRMALQESLIKMVLTTSALTRMIYRTENGNTIELMEQMNGFYQSEWYISFLNRSNYDFKIVHI